ncbi:MAG: CopG family transcriptional regulator [Planctomycetota bacterium]
MPAAKIAITLDRTLLDLLDRWVSEGRFPSRSRAIQEAVRETVERRKRTRLAREIAKLSRRGEKALANERLKGETTWPEY